MPRILHPQWRKSHETTKYPFSSGASLGTDTGNSLLEGTFLDAAIYPVGGSSGLHLSSVIIDHLTAVINISDSETTDIASGSFSITTPPDNVALEDVYGRPAGVLVSDTGRLSVLQAWGVGTHSFDATAAEFVATVCFPAPEIGLRGFLLEDGSFFSGKVWLVGEDGVVIRSGRVSEPEGCETPAVDLESIRIDMVGDPLFRRRLCQPVPDLFLTPNPIKSVLVLDADGLEVFVCSPNEHGDLQIMATNNLAADTLLRLRNTAAGVTLEAVGSRVSTPGVIGG